MSKESELLKNDYLWDGSGEPDAEVLKLERALGKFRHAGRAPELSEILAAARESKKSLGGARLWFQFAAVAASVLLVFSVWVGLRQQSETPASGVCLRPTKNRARASRLPRLDKWISIRRRDCGWWSREPRERDWIWSAERFTR